MKHSAAKYAKEGCRCEVCRAASTAAHQRWVAKNRERFLTYQSEYRYSERIEKEQARNAWFTATLDLWRRTQGCADCGTKTGTLHHHHLDKATKRCNVGNMARANLETLLDEIDKCVVLCAKCHYWRHRRLREEKACQASSAST
jgi:hypothetical protein